MTHRCRTQHMAEHCEKAGTWKNPCCENNMGRRETFLHFLLRPVLFGTNALGTLIFWCGWSKKTQFKWIQKAILLLLFFVFQKLSTPPKKCCKSCSIWGHFPEHRGGGFTFFLAENLSKYPFVLNTTKYGRFILHQLDCELCLPQGPFESSKNWYKNMPHLSQNTGCDKAFGLPSPVFSIELGGKADTTRGPTALAIGVFKGMCAYLVLHIPRVQSAGKDNWWYMFTSPLFQTK